MRVLFTGASSFTGMWFARALAAAGHCVTTTFRQAPGQYPDDLRRERMSLVAACCEPVHGVAFGEAKFLELVRGRSWDLLAHHAADVTGYRSPAFDAVAAVQNNTRNLPEVLAALGSGGCSRVLLTGSVFEGGEGAGSRSPTGVDDMSPYGLSKAMTFDLFRFYCARSGFSLGKFVIPNPFGPYEEPRFTAYLVRSWLDRKVASCNSPLYVRDNVHVELLTRAYVRFAQELPGSPGLERLNPSGYVETQGEFVRRLAREMRPRLEVPCEFELKEQREFEEPRVRINTDPIDARAHHWDEAAAWDEMARYYLQVHSS